MTFNFNPTDYAFTSDIPDVFTISDFQGETLILRIFLNRSTNPIFETTLYVYNNKADIYDLRSVIEDYMEVHGMPFADCSFALQVDRTDYSIPEFKLFYCHSAVSGSCKDWLQSHFATNHAVRLVPRDFFLDLVYYVFPDEQGKCSTHLVIQPSDGSAPVAYDIDSPLSTPRNSSRTRLKWMNLTSFLFYPKVFRVNSLLPPFNVAHVRSRFSSQTNNPRSAFTTRTNTTILMCSTLRLRPSANSLSLVPRLSVAEHHLPTMTKPK